MTDDAPAPGRRRLLIIVAVAAVIVGGVVAISLLVQSRSPERSVHGLCATLTDAADLDRSLTSLDPTTLRPQVAALSRATKVAPKDIAPAVTTVSDFVRQVLADVDASDGDRRSAFADALDARADQIDAVGAAGRELTGWTSTNCGFELGRLSTTPATR